MSWVWEKATDVVEGVGGAVTDVVEGVGGAVLDAVEDVGEVVTGIIEDPKKLAAVAISVAFPGAGTAIGQSLLGPALSASLGAVGTQIVGQTIINTAIQGGDLEQGLLTAGVSAMTPMLAKNIASSAIEQGVDKTIASAGAKVAAGTIQAAALGQDPLTALTFGAVDQATDAILNKAITESGLQKEFSALPAPAKIAVSSAITSALTGADASMLAANQIVQNAIGMATQEVKRQDAKEFFRNQFSDIGYDMTEDELNQVFQNVNDKKEAEKLYDLILSQATINVPKSQAKNLQEAAKFAEDANYARFIYDGVAYNTVSPEITSEQLAKEFAEADKLRWTQAEEDKVVELLNREGITATPERVASIMKEWSFNPENPTEGWRDALTEGNKIKISNSRADTIQEAAALAKSLGYTSFDFGDRNYKISGSGEKPYDFFADKNEAIAAARKDLGAGTSFQWTNPQTGKVENLSTYTPTEKKVADQARGNMTNLPILGGVLAGDASGRLAGQSNLYLDKNTGRVLEDTRVFDALGNVISGSINYTTPAVQKAQAAIGSGVRTFMDVGSGLIKGGADIIDALGTVYGLTTGQMDNVAKTLGGNIRSAVDSMRSDEFRGQEKLMQDAINKAGGESQWLAFAETMKQIGVSPLQTAEFIVRTSPSLLVGGGGMALAKMLGAGAKVADAAAILTNATIQGGDVASDSYARDIKAGVSPEQALNNARITGSLASLTSGLANKLIPGALSVEAMAAGQKAGINAMSRVLAGEVGAELAEETSGQVIANLVSGRPWNENVGEIAAKALIGSGALTSGMVAINNALEATGEVPKQVAPDLFVSMGKHINPSYYQGANQITQDISQFLAEDVTKPTFMDTLRNQAAALSLAGASVFAPAQTITFNPADYSNITNSINFATGNTTAPSTGGTTGGITTPTGGTQTGGTTTGGTTTEGTAITGGTTTGTTTGSQTGATGGTGTTGGTSGTTIGGGTGITADIVSEMIQTAINDAKSQGLTGDAALQKAIDNVSSSLGQTKTDFLNLIGKTETTLKQDFSSQIGGVQGQLSDVQSSLTKAIADAKAQGLAGDQALQSAINKVAVDLGTTKADLLNQLGTTESQLKTDFASQIGSVQQQIGTVQDALAKAIEDAKAQGLQGDAALQAGIDAVANSVGTTKADLLAQLGTTEQALRDLYTTGKQETATQITDLEKSLSDKIAANEAAGLSRNEATNKAIQDVAISLGTTRDQLLGQIGQTEQSLRDLYATGQQQTSSNIINIQKTLADQIAANEAAGLSRDAATNKAIQDVSTNLGTTKEQLLGQINQTEQSLRDLYTTGQQQTQQQIAQLDANTQAQFNNLTQEQKNQALALAQTTNNLTSAINTVAQQSAQQVTNVQNQLTNQIQSLSQTTQTQFNNLTTAQQAEVAARVQQGQTLGAAIQDVYDQVSGLGTQVTDLEKQLQAQRLAEEAYRAEQARLAEEAAKKAEEQARSSRYRAMLPGLGIGLGATQPIVDDSIPLAKPEFLTTKGDTRFEGLLEDFQQKVEENDALFDNPTIEEENRDMGSYYSYGNEMPVESVLGLGGDQQTDSTDSSQNPYERGYFYAQGGMVAPLMAAQGGHMSAGTRYGKYAKGGMPSPLMAAGGKMRVDFRKGDAVTGPGDGQSDDIPAMLADGEFVFPADVVAAIGNGSTKAGSDALYDMMHSIRAHVRSAKPKDLPPEIKSPLDFLKTKKRRA